MNASIWKRMKAPSLNAYYLKIALRSGDLSSLRKLLGPRYHLGSFGDGSAALRQRIEAAEQAMGYLGSADWELPHDASKAHALATKALDTLTGAGLAAATGPVTAISALRQYVSGRLYASEPCIGPTIDRSLPVHYDAAPGCGSEPAESGGPAGEGVLLSVLEAIGSALGESGADDFLSSLSLGEAAYLSGYVVGAADARARSAGHVSGGAYSKAIARRALSMACEEPYELDLSFDVALGYLRGEHPPEFRAGLCHGLEDDHVGSYAHLMRTVREMYGE